MPNQQSPLISDYLKDSQRTVSAVSDAVSNAGSVQSATSSSEADSVSKIGLPTIDRLIDTQRYGSGKPRRIVIRGRISRE